MQPVTLYSTNWCSYCRAARSFLSQKGIPFTEVDLTGDDDAREKLTARTGRTTVPQIFVGEHHVGGYDDLRALDRAGGLEPLLARE
jgi:glutaredoxin 3